MAECSSSSCDDVFDEDADESLLQQKDWNKTRTRLLKEQFRNGVSQGEELSLQDGFNFGYKQAVAIGYKTGKLRGTVSAILASSQTQNSVFTLTEKNRFELEDILENLIKFEKDLKKSVLTKCSETDVFKQRDMSTSPPVCLCNGQGQCAVCYDQSVVSDLGLDDLTTSTESERVKTEVCDDLLSKTVLEQISLSYSQIISEAKLTVENYKKKIENIVTENFDSSSK